MNGFEIIHQQAPKYRVSQKKFRCLEGCGIKSMRPIFKTKMLIYQSRVNLDEKVLFGNISHLIDPGIRKMLVKGMFGNKTFHIPFWSMIYLLSKLEFSISNWQCKLKCHINHGPEWNVGFLIPIQTSNLIVVGSLRCLIVPKKIFSSKLAFD